LCASVPAAERTFPEPRMSYLDNGVIRIGVDLALGGAVTFLSSHDQEADYSGNLINSADLGRQIQMSHYSGPWPFVIGDKKPNPHWAGLGWNPIQTGDCYLNPSEVLEHRNDGRELYVKCRPKLWPMNDVPAECLFETWTTLDGPVVHMRFRCTNARSDQTRYRPGAQELPAVYTISRLSRLMSYTGDKPFTGDTLTHVTNDWHRPWPWTRFLATERWAALVDDKSDWGLGVFKADGGEFHGGIHGDGRSDDPKAGSTAYVAPIHRENFDHNIVYEHETHLMVGALTDIRQRFNAMATKTPPAWHFERDRQHWTLHDATDHGFPLKGEWRIRMGLKPWRIEGPTFAWRADQAPFIRLETSLRSEEPATFRLRWKRLDDDRFDDAKSLTFDLPADGDFHTREINLGAVESYHGLITGLTLEPVMPWHQGGEFVLRSLAFGKPPFAKAHAMGP
jgi:hypothetical protein